MNEKPATYYDDIYRGDREKKERYFLPAEESQYFPMWSMAVQWIKDSPLKHTVFDIGCGPGQFADLAHRSGIMVMGGIDFSQEAIDMCQERMKDHSGQFSRQDLNEVPYPWLVPSSFVTSFEVLEHIENDLRVFRNLPRGQRVIFSVPSYKCTGHVRVFPSKMSVLERYGDLLVFQRIHAFGNKKIMWLSEGVIR